MANQFWKKVFIRKDRYSKKWYFTDQLQLVYSILRKYDDFFWKGKKLRFKSYPIKNGSQVTPKLSVDHLKWRNKALEVNESRK